LPVGCPPFVLARLGDVMPPPTSHVCRSRRVCARRCCFLCTR
jgi:hypothetical protein